jgi:uncharacterized damage-inducible protein DinB
MTPQDFLHRLMHVNRGVRRLVELAPEDRFAWAPHAAMMTLGRLCGHLVTLEEWQLRGLLTGDWQASPPIPTTKAAMLGASTSQDAYLDKTLGQMEAAEFFSRTVATPWGAKDTLEGHALFLMQHAVHHRTQLFLYLKQLDFDIGMTELWT